MKAVEFTKLSSKGQVVIPQSIRDEIHLLPGMMFAVTANDDIILLKKIEMPKIKTWKEVTKPFRKAARLSNLTREDLERMIEEVRRLHDKGGS